MTAEAPTVTDLVAALESSPPRLGDCRLVCVDGPAGSGKTSLAAMIVEALTEGRSSVECLHMDDFYDGWAGLRPDLEPRLLSQVFEPLSRGEDTHWQRYDWQRGVFGEWRALHPTDYLVVEGCGSGARAYAEYRSMLVFVEASRQTRLRRGIERDGPAVEPQWLQWMDREQAHFDLNDTRELADVLISTEGL
jgi:uridine kinase